MALGRHHISILCFMLLLLMGFGLLFVSLLITPTLPYLLLDVVLTPEELRDQQKMADTFAILKKATKQAWRPWLVTGVLVTTFSSVGLWAASGRPKAGESV